MFKRASGIAVVVAVVLSVSSAVPAGAQRQDTPWAQARPASVSEAQVQRFVQLWSSRVRDDSFLKQYVVQNDVPKQIADEGFHGLDPSAKTYLIQRLWDHLLEADPRFKAESAILARRDPKQLAQEKVVLYALVFDKAFIQGMRDKFKEPSAPAAPSAPEPTELDRRIEAASQASAMALPDYPEPAGAGLPEPRVITTVPATTSASQIAVPTIQLLDAAVQLPGVLGFTVYSVCSQVGAQSPTCVNNVPLNTPVDVDVNADGVNDVTAQLGAALPTDSVPAVSTSQPFTVGFSVKRLTTGAPLAANVFALFQPPVYPLRFKAGFDGRPSTLANQSNVTLTVEDLVAAATGTTKLLLTVAHQDPGAKSGITFGVRTLDPAGNELDPVDGSIGFDPTPSQVTAEATIAKSSGEDYLVHVTHQAVGQDPIVTPAFVIDATSTPVHSRHVATASVERMPSDVTVHFVKATDGTISADYRANAVISRLAFSDTSTPDVANAGTYSTVSAEASSIPSNVAFSMSPPQTFSYSASDRLPSASMQMQDVQNGQTTQTLSAAVKDVPRSIGLTVAKSSAGVTSIAYTANESLGSLAVGVTRPADGVTASAALTGIPASINLTVDPGTQAVTWNASSPVTSLVFTGNQVAAGRTWATAMQITGIPASWQGSFAAAHPLFKGVSGPIGGLAFTATNHGAVTTLAGNHISAVYRGANKDLDVSLRTTALSLVELTSASSGLTANIQMGGGAPFAVNGDVLDGATRGLLSATLTPLPTSIQLTQNADQLSYTASSNFTIDAALEFGDAAAVLAAPAPPRRVQGFAVRDGGSSAGTGLKASLFLSGAPRSITARPKDGTVTVSSFAPGTLNTLTLDSELDNVVSPMTKVLATQAGIPSPVTFTFGPFKTTTLSNGDKQTSALYTASAPLGALTVDVERGTDHGRLGVSNIPSSMSGTFTVSQNTSTATMTNAQPISGVTATFSRSTTPLTVEAEVQLSDIPTSVSLTYGRISVTQGSDVVTLPGMHLANSAAGMDLFAFAKASLFGGNVQAEAKANIVNLGKTVDAFLSGKTLTVNSTPATQYFELHTWARINYTRTFSGCFPSDCPTFRVQWSGHAGVVPLTINDMMLLLTNFSSVTVKVGLTSSIQGSYEWFKFGWDKITAHVDVDILVEACGGGACPDLVQFTKNQTFTLNVKFHLADNHLGQWIYEDLPGPCNIQTYLKPHPHFTSMNGFLVDGTAAQGGAWLVTPNPEGILPDGAVEAAAALLSPLGGGFDFSIVGDFCF